MPRTTGPTIATIEADSPKVVQPRTAVVDTILIKVASRCNINCSYCYVYHLGDNNWNSLPKVISDETSTAISQSLGALATNQARPFSVVLHGGEPLLLGVEKLRFLLGSLRQHLPPSHPIGLQTNGILITDAILDVCSEFRTTLALSLDGPPSTNDKFRVDHKVRGTFSRVMKGLESLDRRADRKELFSGFLAVIDPASDPRKIYSFFKEINAPSVDFLHKDGNHSRLPPGKSSLNSVEYGQWLLELLQVYLADPNPIAIRVLDDMMKLCLGGSGTKEGIGTEHYGILIIDTDGSITKNDTLKSAYPGADQFDQEWNVHTTSLTWILQSRTFTHYVDTQHPQARDCQICPYLNICGGGMMLHRWKDGTGFNNPSVYCADQRHLIRSMLDILRSYKAIK